MPRIYVLLPILKDEKLEQVTVKEISSATPPGVEFKVESLEYGPSSIETMYDEEIAAPWILEKVKKAEEEGFDAVVIDCMGDPALSGARELVDIPVVGPCQATMAVASTLGEKFSVVTVLESAVPIFTKKAKEYGYDNLMASVRYIDVPVLELEKRRKEVEEALIRESRKAIEEDDADTIILGCTGMIGMAKAIQDAIGLPVVDAGVTPFKYALMLVELGLKQSRKVYPKPLEKFRKLPRG